MPACFALGDMLFSVHLDIVDVFPFALIVDGAIVTVGAAPIGDAAVGPICPIGDVVAGGDCGDCSHAPFYEFHFTFPSV